MRWKTVTLSFCLALNLSLTACARKPSNAAVDPYENFNRVIFAFNQDIDHLIYRPVSKIYRGITPRPLRKGVTNFFDNVGELTTMPNDLLQGKVKYVFLDFWRFVVNSTFGVGGLFDVATKWGLKKHYNDFGMTLAYWGGKANSPYLQIPFLGPSTFRDGLGLAFDYGMSPYPYLPSEWQYSLQGVNLINIRTQLLPTDKLVDNAFDPYIFVRNAYLQHRRAAIIANNQSQRVTESARPSTYRTEPQKPLLSPDEGSLPSTAP